MSVITERPPSHLCIIRLSAIGDTCHTVPVVRAFQAAWPATKITWIIGRVEHGLMRNLPGIEFAILDKSLGWRSYLQLRGGMDRTRFDVLLHMHASARANIVSLAVSAPLRLGFDRARARDFQFYFCNRHLAPRPQQHVMDGLFEFAAEFGVQKDAPKWDIPLEAADRRFAERTIPDSVPTLVISPCTGQRFHNYRNWRIERYAEVADYAHTRYGARVFLTGGNTATERTYGEGIARASACKPENLIGRTTLKQLLALVERASVVLCPDSGPAHMATAVRTPVVGLYATSNRLRTGPYFSQHLVVDKYPEAVQREFKTNVNALRWGQRVRNPDAMDLIQVGDVIEKLDLAFAEKDIRPITAA
jgi:heptosyltransferase I